MIKRTIFAAAALIFSSCSSEDNSYSTCGDSTENTSALLLKFAQKKSSNYTPINYTPIGVNSAPCNIEGNALLFGFTSDYTTGELRWMHPDSTKYSPGALPFGQDTYVTAVGEDLFVLTRYPGILTCIKARDICNPSTFKQVKLDDENPYEVVIVDGVGYMVLWDTHYIQVFDPNTCTPTRKLQLPNLPPLQSGNTSIASRNPASIKASGDTLLISMQRLEWDQSGMSPKTPRGLLVRMKTSGVVIDTISLKLYNPCAFGFAALSNGKLYIPQNGLWDPCMNLLDNNMAGLEAVDLATGTTEVLISGTELGGGIQSLALDEEGQVLYLFVYKEWRNAPVIPFDLKTNTAGAPLPGIIDAFGGIKWDEVGRKLFVGERELNKYGLKVYDPATNTTIMIHDDTKYPLPPYSQTIARW